MWYFARNIPEQTAILAPRAPYPAPEGGYTWRSIFPGTWGYPAVDDLRPAAEACLGFIDGWAHSIGLDPHQFDLVGFSQGAALSYVITILHPKLVRSLTALSGFMPGGADELLIPKMLDGKPIFVAHGRQDGMVPVEKARRSVNLLEKSGALVTYCESDGGHKVSRECFKGLELFFEDLFN
jgi:phospholipase/carboxylesterase